MVKILCLFISVIAAVPAVLQPRAGYHPYPAVLSRYHNNFWKRDDGYDHHREHLSMGDLPVARDKSQDKHEFNWLNYLFSLNKRSDYESDLPSNRYKTSIDRNNFNWLSYIYGINKRHGPETYVVKQDDYDVPDLSEVYDWIQDVKDNKPTWH